MLNGLLKPAKGSDLIPPPYTDDRTDFSACEDCEAPCLEVCETGVLKRTEEGRPFLSFQKAGCSFCGECARACPEGVLSLSRGEGIRVQVYIDPRSCSAWKGVLCFSCKEPCLENAIRFEGLYKPVVIDHRCTACGFCVSRCPTGAIGVRTWS